ncbi:MAG: hypothetical protein KAV82_16315, partial [Phycisphaerae bacterium]|nr:hypothetical protein [Phycisphaerae bacterium]
RYGLVTANHAGVVVITPFLHSPFSILRVLRGELDAIALPWCVVSACKWEALPVDLVLRDPRNAAEDDLSRC